MQGTGGTLTATLYRATAAAGGGSLSATALTCTLATAAYGCGDTTHTVALTAGDFLQLRVTGSNNANPTIDGLP